MQKIPSFYSTMVHHPSLSDLMAASPWAEEEMHASCRCRRVHCLHCATRLSSELITLGTLTVYSPTFLDGHARSSSPPVLLGTSSPPQHSVYALCFSGDSRLLEMFLSDFFLLFYNSLSLSLPPIAPILRPPLSSNSRGQGLKAKPGMMIS